MPHPRGAAAPSRHNNPWQNVGTPVMDLSDSAVHGGGAVGRGNAEPIAVMELSSAPKFGAHAREPPMGNGRRRRRWIWIAIVLVVLAAVGGTVSYFVMKSAKGNAASTSGGRGDALAPGAQNATLPDGDETDAPGSMDGSGEDDDEVGNPKAYPPSKCALPDYQSKNGRIFAVAANGTEVPLTIKGINWFGMEAAEAIPLGLWDNGVNGTTAFQIAAFLEKHNFNAVRLPLMASYLLENTKPNANLINTFKNRAMSVKNYMELLKSIVKVLQHRNIGVMLSMHTLTKTDKGALWYNDDVPETKFLEAIDLLTTNLCDKEYWNVVGIDLKNEPSTATWGDDGPADFRAGAQRIGERMLRGCPQWLGFVEGIYTKHEMQLDGERYWYFDWYGGGLQGARSQSLAFSVPNKLVWAPHYYTPAVFPQQYLYGGGSLGGENTEGENGLQGYVELSDDKLRARVKATTDDMFGFLASETGPAILLGEFGGIYATDAHPMKTTKRTTDYTIEIITQRSWAGGFVWSLNPESEYQYNPADKPGRFFEGALEMDWITENTEFLRGLAAMDTMENLRAFPCFPVAAAAKL